MNIRYYREYSHNYLILDADGVDINSYQYKMVENNKIDGIIPFTVREMNGDVSLYYEIDSKLSLLNRYSKRKMTYEKLVSFLESVMKVSEGLSRFFLDESELVFDLECVFEELSTGNIFFLYYPHNGFEERLFGEEMLKIVDMSDERAAELIYRICDALEAGEISLSAVLRDVLKKETGPSAISEENKINDNAFNNYDDEILEDEDDNEEETVENRIIKIHLPFGLSFLMSILFAMVAGALWYIRYAYILTFEENIIDLSVFMVCVMMSLICLIQSLKNKPKLSRRPADYIDDDDLPEVEEADFREKEDFAASPEDEDKDCEETVLLGFDFGAPVHKLYSLGEDRTNISLDCLPMVIGKLSSCADAIIKDATVSRVHARIFSKDGDTFIQDLNSKNGTYVNGRRLLPNESVAIIPEDELTFGKRKFSYR